MIALISYLIILAVSFIFNLFPRKISLFLGKTLGLVIYILLPIRKKIAYKNIEENFPNLRRKKHKLILKNTYMHFGKVIADFFMIKKLNKNNINQIIKTNSKIDTVLKNNSTSIIVTGHIGNWELFLPFFGLNNIKFSIVAQKIKNDYINDFFFKIRTLNKSVVIFKNEGIKRMLQILNDGYHLGLASDQNAGKAGEKVRFLEGFLSMPKGAAIFHLKTKKPIIFAYCIMTKKNDYNFSAEILDVSTIDPKDEKAILKINSLFAKKLELIIKKNPEQYFWFHKMKNKKQY